MKPTDAAKLARRDLKATFPDVKFSLRCRNYSTFHVTWTDGPTESTVADLLSKYHGWESRGPDDCEYAKANRPDYAVIRYILTHRSPSPERLRAIADALQAQNPHLDLGDTDDPFRSLAQAPESVTYNGTRYHRPHEHADIALLAHRIFNTTTA